MKTIKKAALGTVAALALAIGVAGTGTANADVPGGSTILYPGQCISPNHYIAAGNTQLTFQNDRNIVVSYAGTPTYQFPGTWNAAQQLCMQTDGNLVAYDTANRPVWSMDGESQGHYYSGDILAVQTDGNVVVYQNYGNGPALWSTHTNR
ncbi:hypothetical protein ACIRYZ_18885 [Kitasatospora sp. NPDC101155]|uniref:hypothetical protein n=1 Tax=Kitasatospora sp. NPDC101155 TaxID=3364097 RepID=UPI003814BC16